MSTTGNASQTRRLVRPEEGRLIAGVASGMAEHLRVSTSKTRLVFVITTFIGGVGLITYVALWALTPSKRGTNGPSITPPRILAAGSLALLGMLAIGFDWINVVAVVPALVATIGLTLLWRQANEPKVDAPAGTNWPVFKDVRSSITPRVGAGIGLLVLGLIGFLAAHNSLQQVPKAILPIIVIVAGVLLIMGPSFQRTMRDLSDERRGRIREQERADLATHIHDNVLQSLTLIQRSSADPKEVTRLARASERELRNWLYRPDRKDTKLRTAVEQIAAEVEDDYGIKVELIAVGDCDLNDDLTALVQATREALVNAAKSSGANEVSLYLEVNPTEVASFVRDRGKGFNPKRVPAKRFGIKESIIGRVERHGGTADIKSTVGEGTEVAIRMPRQRGAR